MELGFLYRNLIRPFVFRLPPERSHALAVASFRAPLIWKAFGAVSGRHGERSTSLAGIEVRNPVGLAAGFDKDCVAIESLLSVGFGFVVAGTVTADARPGNPRPRMIRDGRNDALINSLGFPGSGMEAAERRLKRLDPAAAGRTIISISGTEIEPIEACLQRLEPLVAGVELNISSPNTAGLAAFQQPPNLKRLVSALVNMKHKPLFIKMPRMEDGAVFNSLLSAAAEAGADGFVVANTLPVVDERLAVRRGGLSGRPLQDSTLRLVRDARATLGDAATIIGCGGISNAFSARRVLDAGADAVQLYTAMVYDGPGIAGAIVRGLARSGQA